MASSKTIKSAFESMLFTWGEPLDVKLAAEIFNIHWKDAYEYFKELQQEYEQEGRGIVIREVDKTFQYVTREENAGYIERLCTPVKQKRLSQSALEVLAIIAYKQPVTKGEIESIRGIKCDRVLEGLEKKSLIAEVGRANSIGRPILYGTTDMFLKHFGLTSVKELPEIEDIESAIHISEAPDGVDLQQISLDLFSTSAGLIRGGAEEEIEPPLPGQKSMFDTDDDEAEAEAGGDTAEAGDDGAGTDEVAAEAAAEAGNHENEHEQE
ncbi:MAG: SMC-Scp complex subunit ScpB [Clostridia bacterium]|nr:SMC-Scp complex subunit ScpB [Clostridia bacterium]